MDIGIDFKTYFPCELPSDTRERRVFDRLFFLLRKRFLHQRM